MGSTRVTAGRAAPVPAARGPLLDRRALNRALLARQHLLRPVAADVPLDQVLTALVGLQAQNPTPPYFALWTRIAGFDPERLSELIASRRAVRTALMRSTVHLVTADDALALRPVVAPAVGRGFTPGSPFGKAVAGVDRGELARVARELVEQTPRTPAELGALLAQHFPGRDPLALSMAARADLPLVQLPPRGLWCRSGRTVWTTAEHWLGRPLGDPGDPAHLIRRYLAAYGPATVGDIQAWSGLTRLEPAVLALASELEVFRDERDRRLYDLPDAPRPDAGEPVPVRFLAEFDSVLLAHADKTRIIDEPTRRRIFTDNGLIRGAILVEGFARGAWKLVRKGGRADVLIEAMADLPATVRAAVQDRAAAALDFAAPGLVHEISWAT